MSKKKRSGLVVRECNIDKTAAERGLTGEKLAGFLEGLDVAAYTVKINGMVNCGNAPCGYMAPSSPRCKDCPQFEAEYIIGLLHALKGDGAETMWEALKGKSESATMTEPRPAEDAPLS